MESVIKDPRKNPDPSVAFQFCDRISWLKDNSVRGCQASSLLYCINFILELVIRNSSAYNRFTSAAEIFNLLSEHYSAEPEHSDIELPMDIETVIDICNSFSNTNGLLIRLKKNDEWFYKLNYFERV